MSTVEKQKRRDAKTELNSGNEPLILVDDTPYSPIYNDFYYDKNNGVEESIYTYLDGNNIPSRWEQQRSFVIVETGFGTGLNFLLTWKAWRDFYKSKGRSSTGACAVENAKANTGARAETGVNDAKLSPMLYYFSFEKHPLPAAQIWECNIKRGIAADLLKGLLLHYNDICREGICADNFCSNNICGESSVMQSIDEGVELCLIFGDIRQSVAQFPALLRKYNLPAIDAIYLDGFAPSVNPQMWHADNFMPLRQCSHQNTTFATFSVAARVKQAVTASGFSYTKRKGYGNKREMLLGGVNPLFTILEKS